MVSGVARGAISRRDVTFSDEASWDSNGMQENRALYQAVDMRSHMVCYHPTQVCVLCDCAGDAMRCDIRLSLALPPLLLSRHKIKFINAAPQEA